MRQVGDEKEKEKQNKNNKNTKKKTNHGLDEDVVKIMDLLLILKHRFQEKI